MSGLTDSHPLHPCKSLCGKEIELICLGMDLASRWDTSDAEEALQRGKAVPTWAAAEGQGCGSPGLHAAARGGFLWSNRGN